MKILIPLSSDSHNSHSKDNLVLTQYANKDRIFIEIEGYDREVSINIKDLKNVINILSGE